MADDLRHRLRFAAAMTACGLIADLGYLATDAALRFTIIHQWAEAAAFFVTGLAATVVAVSGAVARAEREAGRGR